VVALPLAVCVGLNDPQGPAAVHFQFTPLFKGSFETTAVMGEVPLSCKAEGGVGLNETEIGRVVISMFAGA
jgi:hypothetical protein